MSKTPIINIIIYVIAFIICFVITAINSKDRYSTKYRVAFNSCVKSRIWNELFDNGFILPASGPRINMVTL